jgi:hypothetical protein
MSRKTRSGKFETLIRDAIARDPQLKDQIERGTIKPDVPLKPFLVSCDRAMKGFSYAGLDALLRVIDPGMIKPVGQLRVLLWGGSAADLRDTICVLLRFVHGVSSLPKRMVVLAVPQTRWDSATYDLDPSINLGVYFPNADVV